MQMNAVAVNVAEPCKIPYPTGLTLGVVDFLNDVSYQVMRTEDQLEDIFRLRHDTYKNAGYLEGNADGRFRDDLDLSPNVHNVAIYLAGNLVACIRLHLVTSAQRDCCAIGIFPDEINRRLDAGHIMVDSSRNCCDPKLESRYRTLPLAVIRTSGLLAVHAKAQWTLATIKEGHIPFFRRVLRASSWHEGGVQYNGLDRETTIHLLGSSVEELRIAAKTKQQYFLSTPEERSKLFDGAHGLVPSSAAKILTGEIVDPYWA
jgi:hypothetical protein